MTLPLELDSSAPPRSYDLRDRAERARVCEIALCEGNPEQIASLVDGVLLVDLWPEMVLPPGVRHPWAALIDAPEQRP